MNKFLSFAFALALATPAFAQKMGGSNRNAPTLEQSIQVGGQKMSLNYTSITWASGDSMKQAMDKENGAGMREHINGAAPKAPLGTFTTSIAVSCGDAMLDAGEYKVYFTISDACEWQINFQGKDKTHTVKLNLQDSPEASKRLLLCLYAGDSEGAGVYLSFGNKMGTLDLKPAKPAK